MMMEKTRPKEAATTTAPAAKTAVAAVPKKKSAEDAVAELEQRLAALGGPTSASAGVSAGGPVNEEVELEPPPPYTFPSPQQQPPPPANPVAPAMAPTEREQVKGGKNALLARILAAQEKTKAATAPPLTRPITAQSEDFDLLGPPPPSIEHTTPPPAYNNAVPPAYNAGLFAPMISTMQPPPPAFDAVEDTVMSQLEPPPSYFMAPPPVASAPALEDLLADHDEPPPPFFHAPPPPPPEEEIIMGMEGLSPEERAALLDEQRKIMEQIEREKLANKSAIAAVQADNFDMRSTAHALSAVGANNTNTRASTTRPPSGAVIGNKVNLGGGQEVALHGPERTKEAIKDGTAILVQCVNCENWMQVTGSATLMYCPVCAVVSPIDQTNAAMSKEEAMQMEADRKMAEQLQNEEYEAADQRRPQQRQARSATATGPTTASTRPPPQQEESWWDTVTGMFSTETKETKPTSPTTSSSNSAYPDTTERELGGGTRPAAARVAQRQPLFSCVVDSVNSTVGTLTGTSLSQDREGNVHGVDATSLLAVSNVGRDTEYQQFNSN